jgi:uncharacterized membrane protein
MARLSKRLRFEILRRDGFKCRYCGTVAAERELRVDHVIPEVLGGSTEPSNLATACEPCNGGKSSVSLDDPVVEEVAKDALRWARAMEIAAAGQRAEREERTVHRDAFIEKWDEYNYEYRGEVYQQPLAAEWRTSIDAFIRAGLDDEDLAEAVDTAMSKRHIKSESLFKYFCGICWRMIEQRRDTAATLLHLVDPDEVANG